MKTKPFFAVRVVLDDREGSTFTRDYVRGEQRMGKLTFTSWAVGDFIGIISEGTYQGVQVANVFEIDHSTVVENRRYQHTSH